MLPLKNVATTSPPSHVGQTQHASPKVVLIIGGLVCYQESIVIEMNYLFKVSCLLSRY